MIPTGLAIGFSQNGITVLSQGIRGGDACKDDRGLVTWVSFWKHLRGKSFHPYPYLQALKSIFELDLSRI